MVKSQNGSLCTSSCANIANSQALTRPTCRLRAASGSNSPCVFSSSVYSSVCLHTRTEYSRSATTSRIASGSATSWVIARSESGSSEPTIANRRSCCSCVHSTSRTPTTASKSPHPCLLSGRYVQSERSDYRHA